MSDRMLVVLVHGWSVYDTHTYGELAHRLQEASTKPRAGRFELRQIHLGKYISFRDEVRLEDISRGLENAVQTELKDDLRDGARIAFVTHSTGGPVVRDWWDRYYVRKDQPCPMSHLIMLAPANFGSALAQLGKGRLSRIRSFFNGVEVGQAVLDWLEIGSEYAWQLNQRWICDYTDPSNQSEPVYVFTLTGQTIDRKLYDHLNSYTGELGSDGVVRVAAANMNATHLRLIQEISPSDLKKYRRAVIKAGRSFDAFDHAWKPNLNIENTIAHAPETAFGLVRGRSHSGGNKGILNSIRKTGTHPTVSAVLKCLRVKDETDYTKLVQDFKTQTAKVYEQERYEYVRKIGPDAAYFHDKFSMVIVRVVDDHGHAVTDFDLKLTGKKNSPDGLPRGFIVDVQRNQIFRNTLTFYFNHDVMTGNTLVREEKGGKKRTVRKRGEGLDRLGIHLVARPNLGYVHYMPAVLRSSAKVLQEFVKPHQTTLVEIQLKRIVGSGVFALDQWHESYKSQDFRDQEIGEMID